jgi:hypothetical protein
MAASRDVYVLPFPTKSRDSSVSYKLTIEVADY